MGNEKYILISFIWICDNEFVFLFFVSFSMKELKDNCFNMVLISAMPTCKIHLLFNATCVKKISIFKAKNTITEQT